MNIKPAEFYLLQRIMWSVLFACLWLPVLFLVNEITAGILIMTFINAALPLVGIWYISVMPISNKGIILYRVNKLVWSDITEASFFSVFGLKHIRLKRKKGMGWSLPLYFVGLVM